MTGTLIGIGWLYMSGAARVASRAAARQRGPASRPAYIHARVRSKSMPARPRSPSIELDAIRDQITRIWRQEGVEVHLGSRSRREPRRHPPAPASWRMPLTGRRPATSGPPAPSARSAMLGGAPDPELNVFVRAVREFVRRRPAHPSPRACRRSKPPGSWVV